MLIRSTSRAFGVFARVDAVAVRGAMAVDCFCNCARSSTCCCRGIKAFSAALVAIVLMFSPLCVPAATFSCRVRSVSRAALAFVSASSCLCSCTAINSSIRVRSELSKCAVASLMGNDACDEVGATAAEVGAAPVGAASTRDASTWNRS